MGLFTFVRHQCECGSSVEFQSKACKEMEYGEHDIEAVPVEVAKDIAGDVEKCFNCGKQYQIKVSPRDISDVSMKVEEI